MTAYAYFCRNCGGIVFRVCWYSAPVTPEGEAKEPGWAIECVSCNRVTMIPKEPDLSEIEMLP